MDLSSLTGPLDETSIMLHASGGILILAGVTNMSPNSDHAGLELLLILHGAISVEFGVDEFFRSITLLHGDLKAARGPTDPVWNNLCAILVFLLDLHSNPVCLGLVSSASAVPDLDQELARLEWCLMDLWPIRFAEQHYIVGEG